MDVRRKNKSAQLGMDYGTASARLQRMILLKLIRETGQNFCFQCGGEIMSIDELSIEHKKPWQYRDTDLFWDLDNIAFSHRECNSRAASRKFPKTSPNKCRKYQDEHTAWCYNCKSFVSKDRFTKNKHHWNGLDMECKDCRSKRRSGSVA